MTLKYSKCIFEFSLKKAQYTRRKQVQMQLSYNFNELTDHPGCCKTSGTQNHLRLHWEQSSSD